MFAPAGLNAGLFVSTQHVITRPQGLVLPTALVEVQDTTGLDGESRVAWKYPTAMPPRPQRVVAEPTPQRGTADLGNQTVSYGLAPQLAE